MRAEGLRRGKLARDALTCLHRFSTIAREGGRLCGLGKAALSLDEVAGHTPALFVHEPHAILAQGITLGGGLLKQAHRFALILRHAPSLGVHES